MNNSTTDAGPPPLSLYIHIPWCLKKCPYCDFNSHAAKTALPETGYVDALLKDLATDLDHYRIDRTLHSIFIGGGTPSLLSAEALDRLLTGVQRQLAWSDDIEITLEANPGTVETGKFAEFSALGINRLSIGVQSFNDALLTRLGRVHSAAEAIAAAEVAQRVGFDNINLDLMFGLPGASLDSSADDVAQAIALNPAHISFYQLTLEPNTYFHRYPPALPADDAIFAMQQTAQALLAKSGYAQYEISAYSLAGRQCRHNVNYWRFGDYLGIGAGAHGKLSLALPDAVIRTHKPRHPDDYLRDTHRRGGAEPVPVNELPLEFVMNHLRLKTGFTLAHYRQATGLDSDSLEPALTQCLQQALIDGEDGCYRCSARGWNFLDAILEKFIGS